MSWTTAKDELRALVSDGPTDRLRHRKKVLGTMDGVNVVFKTLEFRRITNFTTAASPEGVYVNGVTAAVSTDFPAIGEFTLTTAPVDGDVVEATYFSQWFLDSELDVFLTSAAQWLLIDDVTNVPTGLRPAALHYAAQEAYMKLSIKWAEFLSEQYRTEDAPKEGAFDVVDKYQKAATGMHKKSFDLRNDYYTRSGQALQPLYGAVLGRVSDSTPKR